MSDALTTLNRAHDHLDELFALHQEAILAAAYELASELFARFRADLAVHMRHEEEHVIPIYLRAAAPRWPSELFTGQHQKMLAMLDRIAAQLAELAPGAPGWRRRIIDLLESEAIFKHLGEHHHLAEDQALYPTAADMLRESDDVVDACVTEWRAAEAAAAPLLTRANAVLTDAPAPVAPAPPKS